MWTLSQVNGKALWWAKNGLEKRFNIQNIPKSGLQHDFSMHVHSDVIPLQGHELQMVRPRAVLDRTILDLWVLCQDREFGPAGAARPGARSPLELNLQSMTKPWQLHAFFFSNIPRAYAYAYNSNACQFNGQTLFLKVLIIQTQFGKSNPCGTLCTCVGGNKPHKLFVQASEFHRKWNYHQLADTTAS